MAKIARTLCENAAQHISIVSNYVWEYFEPSITPSHLLPLRKIPPRIAKGGTEVEQK